MSAMETKLLEAFTALGSSIASAIPRIAIGILLIILGLVVAKLIEVTLRTMFARIRFDSLMERAGVAKALRRIGLRQPLSLLLPKLIYFLIIFLLAKTASDAFGLIAISNALGAFFSYLPNIFAALLLLILGTTVGQFTGQMVTQAAENSKLDSAPALGRLVSALIIFLVAMMAIGQLKIDTEMVRIVTSFVLGAAALGFGLAFGLGTWDIVKNLVTGFYTRRLLSVGKSLTIAGQSGVLTTIGPTHAVLSNEGREIFVANARFLEQTSTQNVNPPEQ
jgi:mechanosensitive ion channel-like protein